MKIFCDSIFLVFVLNELSPAHRHADAVFRRARQRCVLPITLLETWGVLTSLHHGRQRISQAQATNLIFDRLPDLTVLEMPLDFCRRAMLSARERGIMGRALFDLLQIEAALAADCEALYTHDPDWSAFIPADHRQKIRRVSADTGREITT